MMDEEEVILKKKRRKKRRRRILIRFVTCVILILALIGLITVISLIVYGVSRLVNRFSQGGSQASVVETGDPAPVSDIDIPNVTIDNPVVVSSDSSSSGDQHLTINLQMLTNNPYSRPGRPLNSVNAVVIHYTASPGGTASQNREYFEDLRIHKTTKASSHFIVGLEGEVVQCIPTREIAYASNQRNDDTVAIECCHKDESGKFNSATLDSMKKLTAWLLVRYGLSANDETIIRHYDVSGKLCPKYFVEHEDEWKKFKDSVADYIEKNKEALKADDYLIFKQ